MTKEEIEALKSQAACIISDLGMLHDESPEIVSDAIAIIQALVAALAQWPEVRNSKAWSEMSSLEREAYNRGYMDGESSRAGKLSPPDMNKEG